MKKVRGKVFSGRSRGTTLGFTEIFCSRTRVPAEAYLGTPEI